MLRKFIPIAAAFVLSAPGAFAATFTYDIFITDISGEGEAENIGLFSTGNIGDAGTGMARTDSEVPTTTPMQLLDNSIFSVTFPGIASAVSFFFNPVVHDPLAGTVTVNGSLGGFTGVYPEFISASTFEFIYQGTPGGEFASIADYDAFMSTATMSGFASAFFISTEDDDVGYFQRVDFAADVPEIPLPAGAVLMLSALGLLAAKRRKTTT